MATLSELVKKRRESGSTVGGALSYGIKERLKEKFDPRQFFDQSGLLTALFPKLRAYKAGRQSLDGNKLSKLSKPEVSFSDTFLESIQSNTKIAAKNSMILPAMHRDINVMRQNIIKLVKLKGGVATNKADMWFMNAKTQEAAYETRFNKKTPTKIEKEDKPQEDESGGLLKMLGDQLSKITDGINSLVTASVAGAISGAMSGIVASVASKLLPMVFSWASIPALGLSLASQQASSADLNNQQQGIIEPIKRAYEAATKGDLKKVAEEIGNINVFTAVGRFGLETSGAMNDVLGKTAEWDKRRTENRNMETAPSPALSDATKFRGTTTDAVKHYEKMYENEKDPEKKKQILGALNQVKKMAEKDSKPVEQKVETKSPTPSPKVETKSQQSTPEVQKKVETGRPEIQPKPEVKTSQVVPEPKIGAVIEKSTEETKTATRESNKPIVNVTEMTENKTVNAPSAPAGNVDVASVYDAEMISLLGIGVPA